MILTGSKENTYLKYEDEDEPRLVPGTIYGIKNLLVRQALTPDYVGWPPKCQDNHGRPVYVCSAQCADIYMQAKCEIHADGLCSVCRQPPPMK